MPSGTSSPVSSFALSWFLPLPPTIPLPWVSMLETGAPLPTLISPYRWQVEAHSYVGGNLFIHSFTHIILISCSCTKLCLRCGKDSGERSCFIHGAYIMGGWGLDTVSFPLWFFGPCRWMPGSGASLHYALIHSSCPGISTHLQNIEEGGSMIMVPTPGTTHLHDEPGAWGQHPDSGPSLFRLPVTLSPSQETSWPQFFIMWGFGKPQGSEGAERPVSSSAPHWWTAPLAGAVGRGGEMPRAQYHHHCQPR